MNKLAKYIFRLTQEWKKHSKIIIAVDFDDTISTWGLNTKDECNFVIEKLKTYQEMGAYVVIFTACKEDRYKDISDFCYNNGLTISSINKNPIDLPYGNVSKVYANIFLDDRAGLFEALEILDGALANMRALKYGGSLDNSEFAQFQ